MDISNREAYLQQLHTFISENKRKADTFLQTLGWTPEKTLQQTCPRKKGKPENVPSLPTKHTTVFEPHTIHELVGNALDCDSPDDISMAQLSAEQKLALYEYCIEKTGKLSEPEITIKFDSEEDGKKREMTFAEIVARKRNLKRRTTRYRTGASQSYVAELRSLIEIQMGALRQYIDDNSNKDTDKKHQESNSSRRSDGHRSSSRHHDLDYERRSSHKQKKYARKSPKRYRSRER